MVITILVNVQPYQYPFESSLYSSSSKIVLDKIWPSLNGFKSFMRFHDVGESLSELEPL